MKSWPTIFGLARFIAGLAFLTLAAHAGPPQPKVPTSALLQHLNTQGVAAERIVGVDVHGVPCVCGVDGNVSASFKSSSDPPSLGGIPAGTRAWEVIPSVIRNDGIESFRLEVNVNGPVSAVRTYVAVNFLTSAGSNDTTIYLRDDGQGGDRVAGDYIFTSEPLRFNTGFPMADHYRYDSNSPAGLDFKTIYYTEIVETNGAVSQFLVYPCVGILDSAIPTTPTVTVTSNLVISSHLINLRSDGRDTQRHLRGMGDNLPGLTQQIYQSIPDYFDFLMFFSNDHVEYLPYTATANFNVGLHNTLRVNYTGTGLALSSNNAFYGSAGRLLGINVFDTHDRGIYTQNVTHELIHQWACYNSTALSMGDGHYSYRSSVGSLVGGFRFLTNGNGTFTLDCDEGQNAATYACPLDKYMMGLIPSTLVATQRVYSASLPPPLQLCGQAISNFDATVTIGNIISLHGTRTPGPATAQRNFAIGFVMETYQRTLNPTEFAFFNLLAQHYTKAFPTNQPAPYVGQNWVPITRFFEEGTTWRSDVPALTNLSPNIDRLSNGTVRISGFGAPSLTYKLAASTNLSTWTTLSNVTTSTNGFFQAFDPTNVLKRFYRLVWP
jgi:hypothetical protein